MNLTYLSRSVILIYFSLLLLFILGGSIKFFLITLFSLFVHMFLYRKKIVFDHEDQITTIGTVFAPISGRILDITEFENDKVIIIKTAFYDNFGIYLPVTCEVRNLFFNKDVYLYRYTQKVLIDKDQGMTLELLDKKDRIISINFIRFFTGKWPDLVVMPGDRGRRQSSIGFFPFGGVTRVFLPKQYIIDVNIDDRVISTETIIARYSEEEK